jgi:hypothetical protein
MPDATNNKPDAAGATKPPDVVAASGTQAATVAKIVPEAPAAAPGQRDGNVSAENDVDEDDLDENDVDELEFNDENDVDEAEFDEDDLDEDDEDELDWEYLVQVRASGPDEQAEEPEPLGLDRDESQGTEHKPPDPHGDVKLVAYVTGMAVQLAQLHAGVAPLSLLMPDAGGSLRGMELNRATVSASMGHVGSQMVGGVAKAEALWNKVTGKESGDER